MCYSLDEFDTTPCPEGIGDEGQGFERNFAKEVDVDLGNSTIAIGLMTDEFVRCKS
jgi:hypothetical protein